MPATNNTYRHHRFHIQIIKPLVHIENEIFNGNIEKIYSNTDKSNGNNMIQSRN